MDDREIEIWFDVPMTTRFEPHRTKSPRQCDRCRKPARWNLRQPGRLTEYVCQGHAEIAARTLGIQPPR